MKLIVLVFGLVLGFGGGIWYGVQHPEWAKDMSAKEEEWIKEGKKQALTQLQQKLDSLTSSQSSSTPIGGRSFVGGGTGGASSDDALKALKSDVAQQLTQLK